MTSWKRGNSNEDKGEDMMRKPEITEKAKGAALKAVGEVEQGIDNVVDKLTGKQDDWKGMDHKGGKKSSSSKSSSSTSRSHTASTTGASGKSSRSHSAKAKSK